MPPPLSDVADLKLHLRALFNEPAIEFTDYASYGVTFVLPGKVKDLKATLLARTDASHWSGEAGHWFYECQQENWTLYLRAVPQAVLCIASVLSLHMRHLEQYKLTPEQQAAIAADTTRAIQTDRDWEQAHLTSDTLTPLGGPFYSDGKRVWVRYGEGPRYRALNYLDLASFRHVVDHFAVDVAGLRYYARGSYDALSDGAIVKGADPATLIRLGGHWYRDARQAYYFEWDSWQFHAPVVVKADVASLEYLGGAYARDARSLYCAGIRKRAIMDVSRVVSLGYRYARIDADLLHDGKIVSRPGPIDVDTARAVRENLLIDARGHMLLGTRYRKPLPGIDARSLRFLTPYFAVDDHRVYFLTNANLAVCELADRATVEVASRWRIRDQHGLIDLQDTGVVRVSDDAV
ncbi:hypothetical protein [Paraburkholderia bannensis]|uniref:hypothetical protein n=1 Tax=Paraburkholderia bannensis TaxID=765414 RepID=UPI002AB5E105|nr:hypothetical protein [Paraburkholderia bannensis]